MGLLWDLTSNVVEIEARIDIERGLINVIKNITLGPAQIPFTQRRWRGEFTSRWKRQSQLHKSRVATCIGAFVDGGHKGLVEVENVVVIIQVLDCRCTFQHCAGADGWVVDLDAFDVVVGRVVLV